MINCNILVIGDLYLVNKVINKLYTIGFKGVRGFGIHTKCNYEEIIDPKHFVFSNTYLEYYQQMLVQNNNKLPLNSYTDYNEALHATLRLQFKKLFSNLEMTQLQPLRHTNKSSNEQVTVINDFKELTIHQSDKPIVEYMNKIINAKMVIYTDNYFPEPSTIPDLNYQKFMLSEKEIIDCDPKQCHLTSFHLQQKAQNAVFCLQPYSISQKIVVEILNNNVWLITFGFDEKESNFYFQEISKVFKINYKRHKIDVTLKDLPNDSYSYRIWHKYHSTSRQSTDLCFKLLGSTDIIVTDSTKLVSRKHVPFDPMYTLNLVLSVLIIKLARKFGYTKYFIRGTHNNWSCSPMEKVNEFLSCGTVDSRSSKIELKIDTGIWIESFPDKGNYIIPKGDVYKVYFNSVTNDIYHLSNNVPKRWYVRGSFNNWSLDHEMHYSGVEYYHFIDNDDNKTETRVFKIDNGTWTHSYPEENGVLNKGKYMITFNLITKEIKTISLNNDQYLFFEEEEFLFMKPQLHQHHDLVRESYPFDILDFI